MSQDPEGTDERRSYFYDSDADIDFPHRDYLEDPAGNLRPFLIRCHEGSMGYRLTATEEVEGLLGYEVSTFSETSPYGALGELRSKLRRALAIRHLRFREEHSQLLHHTMRGRIASRDGELLLVVDGRPILLEDLGRILETHEGFEFHLRIADINEDIWP